MVAIVDYAHAFVDVLTDNVSTRGCRPTNALIVTVNICVVVVQQVSPNVVDMLVVRFTSIVTLTSTFVFTDTLSDGQPGCRSVQVSFVVDDFVDMVGHLGCGLTAKATDDHVVVAVATSDLSVRVVTLAGIRTGACTHTGDLCHVANEKDVGQIGMLVIVSCDVTLDSSVGRAGSTRSHHGGRTTDLFLPCHKRLHGRHEIVVTDDEQLACLFNGCISRHRSLVVDITVLVHGLEFGIHDEGGVAAFDDVARVVANLIHAQDEVMIHSEHLRDGVVLARRDHHVLSSHVAMDVWLIEFHELGREEGVVPIGLTIGVRHVIRVDATWEVAFGGRDFHVGVVGVLGADDLDAHQGSVADDGGDRDHREIRLPGGSDADGLGKRHDAGLTLRRGDLGGEKS